MLSRDHIEWSLREAQLDAIERHRRAGVHLVITGDQREVVRITPEDAIRSLGLDPVTWRRELPEDRDPEVRRRMDGDVGAYIPPPMIDDARRDDA